MRSRSILSGALVLALVTSAVPVFARTSRFSLAVHGGLAGQEENNLRPGLEAGLEASLRLSGRFSLSTEVALWKTLSKDSYRKLYRGELEVAPVQISLRYEFRPNAYFIPYLFSGASYVFTRFRIGRLTALPEGRIDQEVRSGAAGHFGLGVRVPLSWRWSFFSEAAYILRNAPARTFVWDADQVLTRDDIWVNLHIVLLKFGLRFYL